ISTTTLPGPMPAKASISAGLRFSSRAVSAAGRSLSATAAFIFAVGAAANTMTPDASKAAPAISRVVRFMIHSPKFSCHKPSAFPQGHRRAQMCLLSRDLNGKARLLLGGVDHQRAFHAGDILLCRDRVGDEALECRQVPRHAFEDEIHFPRQHVALAHFRPAARAFLEVLEVAVLLAGQADKDEPGDLKAKRLAVQFGMIAADITR